MVQEIEKLIKAAEAKGEITERQLDIIISKAKSLGDDLEEVEFYLESIPLKDSFKYINTSEAQVQIQKRKCRNCGAYVSTMETNCPECGCRMETESDASIKTRQIIANLQSKLGTKRSRKKGEDEFDYKENLANDRVELIGTFSVPLTFDAQVIAFNHTKSQYDAIKSVEDKEKEVKAWLGKAKEFYYNISSMQTKDPGVANWLNLNSSIVKVQGKRVLTTGSKAIAFLIVCILLFAVYLEWTLLSWGNFWKIILIVYTLFLLLFIDLLPKKEI